MSDDAAVLAPLLRHGTWQAFVAQEAAADVETYRDTLWAALKGGLGLPPGPRLEPAARTLIEEFLAARIPSSQALQQSPAAIRHLCAQKGLLLPLWPMAPTPQPWSSIRVSPYHYALSGTFAVYCPVDAALPACLEPRNRLLSPDQKVALIVTYCDERPELLQWLRVDSRWRASYEFYESHAMGCTQAYLYYWQRLQHSHAWMRQQMAERALKHFANPKAWALLDPTDALRPRVFVPFLFMASVHHTATIGYVSSNPASLLDVLPDDHFRVALRCLLGIPRFEAELQQWMDVEAYVKHERPWSLSQMRLGGHCRSGLLVRHVQGTNVHLVVDFCPARVLRAFSMADDVAGMRQVLHHAASATAKVLGGGAASTYGDEPPRADGRIRWCIVLQPQGVGEEAKEEKAPERLPESTKEEAEEGEASSANGGACWFACDNVVASSPVEARLWYLALFLHRSNFVCDARQVATGKYAHVLERKGRVTDTRQRYLDKHCRPDDLPRLQHDYPRFRSLVRLAGGASPPPTPTVRAHLVLADLDNVFWADRVPPALPVQAILDKAPPAPGCASP